MPEGEGLYHAAMLFTTSKPPPQPQPQTLGPSIYSPSCAAGEACDESCPRAAIVLAAPRLILPNVAPAQQQQQQQHQFWREGGAERGY